MAKGFRRETKKPVKRLEAVEIRPVPVERPRMMHVYTRTYIDNFMRNLMFSSRVPKVVLQPVQVNDVVNNERPDNPEN